MSAISSACSPVSGWETSSSSTLTLAFGHPVERQRRLARGLRSVDLDDAPAGKAADAEGDVERGRAGLNDRDLGVDILLAHLHDRALAELLLDRSDGELDRLLSSTRVVSLLACHRLVS
jgi:hypothetical protein